VEANPIIILGTGLAGYTLAKEFRKLDPNTPLILITQDDGHFYSKPQLSTALLHGKTAENLVITDCKKMKAQLNATIYPFSACEAIHTTSQEITIKTPYDQQTIGYQKLVLALGAIPHCFPYDEQTKSYYQINNLLDYTRFRENLPNLKHVTILGSGLVGCELAHDLTHLNIPISVISQEPYPLHRFVPAKIGTALQQALSDKGVIWHAEDSIQHIEPFGSLLSLRLNSGNHFETSTIISAIGLKPNTKLAQQANIQVKHGIVVDEYLETSVSKIFALGDCAEILGTCRQFVSPLLNCTRALAQTLSHHPTSVVLPPTPIVLKVSSYPIHMLPPLPNQIGKWQFEETKDGIKALFYNEDQTLAGYVLTGSFLEERQKLYALALKTAV